MGGKAFDDVLPIPRENVQKIVDEFVHMAGIRNYEILGSAGKKPMSGDIDIGLSRDAYHIKRVYGDLISFLSLKNLNTRAMALGQLFCRFGDENGPLQIDVQVGDLDLLRFTYWSPDEGTSEYTGLHRTELLKACAKVLDSETREHDGSVVARTGYTLMPNEGLVHSTRWRKPLVKGHGYVSRMNEVEIMDIPVFTKHFPDLQVVPTGVIADVNWICWKMFGDIKKEELNTYEGVSQVISRCSKYQDTDLIWDLYTERLNTIHAIIPRRLI